MAAEVPRRNSRITDAGVSQWIPHWTSFVFAVERRLAEEANQVRIKPGRVRSGLSLSGLPARAN